MKLLLLIPAVALAGCAATPSAPERIIETQEVLTPVPVSCVPETLGGPPEYSDRDDALRSAPDGAERHRLLILGRGERDSRLAEVEYALEKCKDIPYAR